MDKKRFSPLFLSDVAKKRISPECVCGGCRQVM